MSATSFAPPLLDLDRVDALLAAARASAPLRNQLVHVARLDGTEVVHVGVHAGRTVFAATPRIGERSRAALSAEGSALLALIDDALIETVFTAPDAFARPTLRATSSVDSLLLKLRATRERGWALDEGEQHPSVFGVAVAIPVDETTPSLALGVSLVEVQPHIVAADSPRYGAVAAELIAIARRFSSASH